MRINTNMSSLIGWRNMSGVDRDLTRSLERLSSGYRINRAGDDVAGLGISENMRAQIRGLNQAVQNVRDGTNLIQTAEASLNEVHTILQRMRELALQASNGTLGASDRVSIQTEMDQAAAEITRLTSSTQYNSKQLLDGSMMAATTGQLSLQVGANEGTMVAVEVGAMDAASLGVARDILTGTVDNAGFAGGDLSSSNRVHSQIQAVGDGIVTGKYKLSFSTPPAQVQLADANDQPIGTAMPYDPAAESITVGDAVTGRTVTFKPTSWVQAGDTDVIVIPERTHAVRKAGEVGAGLKAGIYTVEFNASDQTMQLFAGPAQPVGVAMKVKPGETVTLGDPNTGRTVKVQIAEQLPAQNAVDTLNIGGPLGRVTSTLPQPRPILAGNPQGVVGTGAGLTNGATYNIYYNANTDTVQLRLGGIDIGLAVAFVPDTVVTLGDGATNETLTLRLGKERSPVSASASVLVSRTATVDNGVPTFPLATNTIAASVESVSTGLVNGNYRINYDQSTNQVYLTTGAGVPIGAGATLDPNQLSMTIGDAATGRTVTFQLQTPSPATSTSDAFTVQNWRNGIAQVNAAGAGMVAGSYRVVYDNVAEELQLQTAGGVDIGAAVPVTAGAVVTIGDGAGQTLVVQMGNLLPTGNTTDIIVMDGARVVQDAAGWSNNWLVSPGAGSVSNVDLGLTSGTYRIAYDKPTDTITLLDAAGRRIGGPMAVPAGPPAQTVTLGDATTNRTIDLSVLGGTFADSFVQSVEIINNDGVAHGAQFEGGMRSLSASARGGVNVSSADAAQEALLAIDGAIKKITDQRAQLGAVQNRLEHTAVNLEVVSENLVAASSRLRDADMAKEMTDMTKRQMLFQAAASLLAQANQKAQSVLQLLRQ
ncbi:MAG TPA: flagellin [Symbiobacteriaceae bacterium]|nr:flagellin [Symbiobacteriaceae bacterium]